MGFPTRSSMWGLDMNCPRLARRTPGATLRTPYDGCKVRAAAHKLALWHGVSARDLHKPHAGRALFDIKAENGFVLGRGVLRALSNEADNERGDDQHRENRKRDLARIQSTPFAG